MAKILITGGTGLIGQVLTKKLELLKHEVVILSRNPKEKNQYKWNIQDQYIDEEALKNTTHIIHLAGAGIADKRWTKQRKQELLSSRIDTANLLYKKVKELNTPLKKFITASGIGIYGAVSDSKIHKETETPYTDFIAKICVDWEKSALQFDKLNIPQTILRTSIVLANKNSALQKMDTPLCLSSLGSGKQIFPYIHIEDLCNIYVKAIQEDDFTGIFNAVAPESQNMNSFIKELSIITKKPVLPINAPSFILKLILGEMAVILLNGSKISSKKIQENYTFKYPDLKSCLKNIYEHNSKAS